ncbi:acyl-CoA dehydrogenase family protein [Baekduia soli]|uniref:acyl-CoA dehydrogenase family protein n=1 Tax=Baekduia soli TaxID=496014 RepID=UPI00165261F2|nr:acyl-CoA dehydrogenase family protein [Baekduia soli]
MSTSVVLGDDQRDIRDVARRFLTARYPADVVRAGLRASGSPDPSGWRELCELGWPGIALPEDRGGAGYSTVERCLVLEEAGHVLLPEPLLSCGVLAADALALAAGGAEADALLARVVDGDVRAVLVAAGDLLGGAEPHGAVHADGGSLQGDGGLVPDADRAEVLLVAARGADGATGLYAVARDDPGVTVAPLPLVDETRGHAVVTLQGAAAQPLGDGDATSALRTVLDRGAIALAAEMIGGAQQAVQMTLAYLRERHQFGVPIGSFQALKHRMADLHVAVVAARESVYLAAEADDGRQDALLGALASAAKVAAGEAFVRAGAEGIQMHGGIGMTHEADPHLYYKRALVSAATLGTTAGHRERVARALDA